MNSDKLDRVLSHDVEIAPSPGFTQSVMTAIRSEASALPPISFPWIYALPGLAVGVISVVLNAIIVADGVHLPMAESAGGVLSSLQAWLDGFAPALTTAESLGFGWVLLAFVMTAACLELSRILLRRV